MPRKPALALPLLLAALLGSASAAAQTCGAGQACKTANGPLDRFEPSPAGDAFFAVPSADVTGRFRPALGLTLSYAKDPLVLTTVSRRAPPLEWVDHQMILHTQLSFELLARLKLELDLPATLTEGGTSGAIAGTSVAAPSGASFNDIRVGGRVVLLKRDGGIPAAALSLSAWLPTGKAASFTGSGTVRFAPALILGAEYKRWAWSAHFGRRFQSEKTDQIVGSQIFGGAALAARVWRLQIGPELSVSTGAGDKVAGIINDAGAAELVLGARGIFGPIIAGLGGGPGIGLGPGTPTYRLFVSIGFAPELGKKPAPDKPAFVNVPSSGQTGPAQVAPPPVPAAPLDTDGDGIADADDACPAIVGVASPDKARNGCPPDRDRDGIVDAEDACPDEPGVYSSDPKKNGCPPDTDGDGIVDGKDACPNEKGKATSDPKTNGCPDSVRVEGTQIIILQQVQFDTAKATLKKESDELLSQVAAVLAQHPEIARVAVDGHTDNKGFEKDNVNLSQRRALAVVSWLTEHGVDARRLEARGFGPRRPIADNKTDAGRQKNRRVEFLIKKRTDLGEAGWKDGPVE